MRGAVHQFHQGIRRGDAIGEEMLALRSILRRAGYESDVYVAEPVPDDLKGEIRQLDEYRDDSDHLLLQHHSIGHHSAGHLARLADRKVLVYHNITPARFFVGNPYMQRFLERGRRQLSTMRPYLAGAFADSEYNAAELRRAGYLRIEILPPVFALGRLAGEVTASEPKSEGTSILFVGRFATSKRQDDVVRAFEAFAARYDPRARLVLAGGADPNDPYAQLVFRRIEQSPFRDRIETPGIVSDRELARLYRQASVYLSMSEHEGFGVPLLESFAAGVPVVAFDSGAVAETMGGGGVVFARKAMDEVAALLAEVVFDSGLRERIVHGQRERLHRSDIARAEENFLSAVEEWLRLRTVPAKPGLSPREIRIDGPFESSYGLAVANRRLAEALANHTGHRVSIHCTEGPGDYMPRAADLADKPLARKLWERSFAGPRPDVVIRNTYPPRFDRLPARLQLANFAWEDSILPPGWAEGFNSAYDGILTPSSYVRDVLRRSGVTIPVEVVPNVVELQATAETDAPSPVSTAKTTRLLCVGSAFPRKGVDVLIRAYVRAFRRADDVVLIIKSFPNIHNTVASQLEEVRRKDPDAPEIVHVDRDIPHGELLALYRTSDALVHPSRAEGFGFPVAEAMLVGLPVIAPSSTGLADFCTEETALVIPHRWEPSGSHFEIPGAEWAEPDQDALAELLRGFVSGPLRAEALRRAERARHLVSDRFSARAVARAAEGAIEELEARSRPVSVGFVSTWNSRCGIASYTGSLIGALPPGEGQVFVFGNSDASVLGPDGSEVERVWVQGTGDYIRIVNETLERGVETVHIQFHPGLFAEYHELSRAIHGLCDRGIRVLVTVHLAVEEVFFYSHRMVLQDLVEAFSRCERLFVHGEEDFLRLSELGLGSRLEKLPHGGIVFPVRARAELARELGLGERRVVASFGYAFAHKGVLQTIEAVNLLRKRFPDLFFLALAARRPDGDSGEYLSLCWRRVSELGLENAVSILDEYLSEHEIGVLLSCAEVAVLPYGPTLESASGAVRYPLACGRATITTRERIFDDVRDTVLQIPDNSPESIAAAIELVLTDDGLRTGLEARARRYAVERSWPRVATRHLERYREAQNTGRISRSLAAFG